MSLESHRQIRRTNMRQILVLFLPLFLLFTGCKTNFEVARASKQEWFGGAAGSGGGINYKVFLTKPEKSEVKVDKVYVGDREKGQYVPFRFFNDSTTTTTTMMVPSGSTNFRVEFSEQIQGQRQPRMEVSDPTPLQDDAPADLPEDFKKGVVLFLSDGNGKPSIVTVQDFKRLAPIAYP